MGRAARRLLLMLGLWLPAAACQAAPGIAVVASRDAPHMTLDRATLRDVYLKKVFVDRHGDALVPVNLPPDDPLRRAFSRAVLGEAPESLQGYWNERYFHGVRPPYVLASQAAVARFVAGTAGAIGYLASCRVDPGLRTLLVLPVPAAEQAALADSCGR